jgi:hypothetical protein
LAAFVGRTQKLHLLPHFSRRFRFRCELADKGIIAIICQLEAARKVYDPVCVLNADDYTVLLREKVSALTADGRS